MRGSGDGYRLGRVPAEEIRRRSRQGSATGGNGDGARKVRDGTGQDWTGQAVPTPGLHQCLVAIRLILQTVVEVLFFFNVRAVETIVVPDYNIYVPPGAVCACMQQ